MTPYDFPMTDPKVTETNESKLEKLDRNWGDILQELRVTQTGNQILFGFLLILPFQSTFSEITGRERWLYLAVFILVSLSTVFNVAPAAAHRLLSDRRRKEELIRVSTTWAKAALTLLGLAMAGAVALVVDMVLGGYWGFVAGFVLIAIVLTLWLLTPLRILHKGADDRLD